MTQYSELELRAPASWTQAQPASLRACLGRPSSLKFGDRVGAAGLLVSHPMAVRAEAEPGGHRPKAVPMAVDDASDTWSGVVWCISAYPWPVVDLEVKAADAAEEPTAISSPELAHGRPAQEPGASPVLALAIG